MKCEHCGMLHETTCPRIKAIEYHTNGTIKRIEFVTDADKRAVHHHDHSPRIIEREPSETERTARDYRRQILKM